ncbi:hypothetical protein [Congregibacter sp.]|jgi:hypothetical protein|uniref:hypothetical protein n=1 Tax=Congregibacter sp. TaxID=2744308 RepID=UPI0039E4FE39
MKRFTLMLLAVFIISISFMRPFAKELVRRAVGLLFLVSLAAEASAITYLVDRDFGIDGKVVGYITTDGTIGTLASANIVDWNLYTEDGVSVLSQRGPLNATNEGLDPANWGVLVRGAALTATATELSFDFGSVGNDLVIFQVAPLGNATDYYCLAANADGTCLNPASESIDINGPSAPHPSLSHTGLVSIGVIDSGPCTDTDGDGFCDDEDVCPRDNPNDTDGDGVCDSDDPCPLDNPDDANADGVCDTTAPVDDCSSLEPGRLRGLCNAYCEATNCDGEHKASDRACNRLMGRYLVASDGEMPPCAVDAEP